MALDGESEFLHFHPRAVVFHEDEIGAAIRHGDIDTVRARVERVLDQLFHGARRPLNHFAGRDPVDRALSEPADCHLDTLRNCRARILPSSTAGWSNGSTPIS